MSKPREFAHLIKNKFGSADNINSLSREFNVIYFYLNFICICFLIIYKLLFVVSLIIICLGINVANLS